MSSAQEYILVHVTTSGEYKTPLVASQLFDQAQFQATEKEGFAPEKVEAWIIGSMREYFEKPAQNRLQMLRARCPAITIKMMNGISRFKKMPTLLLMQMRRNSLGKKKNVIYHCRGEKAAEWALQMKTHYPNDKVILDIRGYWPAELLYNRGIEDPSLAKGNDLAEFTSANEFLKKIIGFCDGVTTVSNSLRALAVSELGAPANTYVVPCCINGITNDDRRTQIRKDWGLGNDEIALVYSGTTAAYQHLDDLTIPFLKRLIAINKKIRLVFLSPEIDKIRAMLQKEGIDIGPVILKKLQQNEVAAALNACDIGILIRKPTLVNRVANPVKIGEYLAAGLPIIISKNVGGVADTMFDQSLLKGIELGSDQASDKAANQVNEWLNEDLSIKRNSVKNYAQKNYTWKSQIHTSRDMYKYVLNK